MYDNHHVFFAGVVLGFVSSEDIVLSETQSGGAVQLEFGVLEGYLSFRVLMNAEFSIGTYIDDRPTKRQPLTQKQTLVITQCL